MKLPIGAAMALSFWIGCAAQASLPSSPTAARKPTSTPDNSATQQPHPDAPEDAVESPATLKPAPTPEPDLPEVVFEPVNPSPAPRRMPTVAILSPARNSVIPLSRVADTTVRLDIKGWNCSDGNHVQVLVDNRPYLRVEDPKRPIKLGELAPIAELGPGQHFVAAMLARANLETVKPAGKKVPAAVVPFFVGNKKQVQWKDGSPMVLYSSPQSGPAPGGELLVDFYVLNAQVARGRQVVHVSVSGPGLRAAESLSDWRPWRVRNARPGLYAIQVALYRFEADELESDSVTSVTYVSKPVPGAWSSITREFTVAEKRD